VVVSDPSTSLGWVIQQIARGQNRSPNGVIEKDVVLVWGPNPRILTGADILSRLLEGI
jgi:metal transporter CNNM